MRSHFGEFPGKVAGRGNSNSGLTDSTLQPVGRWGWGRCHGIATIGNYVLTGSGPTVLLLDATDKHHPTTVWESLSTPSATSSIVGEFTIRDSMAYAYAGTDLIILDLHTLRAPRIVGRLSLGVGFFTLAVGNSLVFAQKWDAGVYCIDVSDPSSPYVRSIANSMATAGPLAIHDNNLFVGDVSGNALEYMDISNPDSIRVFQMLSMPMQITAMQAVDTLLLLTSASQLMIYNVATPTAPTLLSSTTMPDVVMSSLIVKGKTVFVGTDSGKVVSVDVSNVQSPIVRGVYAPPVPPLEFAEYPAIGDSVLFISYGNNITIFSIADPATIVPLSLFPTGDESNKVFARNGLAYITSGLAGLYVVDISNPLSPQRVGNIRTGSYFFDLVIDSSIAYVSINDPGLYRIDERWNGILAIDISRPDSLRVLDAYSLQNPFKISKSGGLLFVSHRDRFGGASDTTLTVLDVSDPLHIRSLSVLSEAYTVNELTSADSVAFLASTSGLKILDCHDPASPFLRATILPLAFGVTVHDQHAYAFSRRPGLPLAKDSVFVIDISNLSEPFVRGVAGKPLTGTAWSLFMESCFSNNRVFWAGGSEIGVCDVLNPAQPRVSFLDFNSGAVGVHALADTVAVAALDEGLWLYSFQTGSSSVAESVSQSKSQLRLLPNYPNPFNPSTTISFTLPRTENITLKVYEMLGREVATLVEGREEAGEHSVKWNAESFASGVYFYQIKAGGFVDTKKLLLIR
jgi:hypothetical protein